VLEDCCGEELEFWYIWDIFILPILILGRVQSKILSDVAEIYALFALQAVN
jgi:hypothetical protein